MPPIGPVRNPAPNVRLPNPLKLLRTLLIKVLGEAANLLDRLSRGNLPIHAASPRGSKAQLVDMHPRRLLLAAPARLSHLSTARHAFRVFNIGARIADEHAPVGHLDRAKRLGVERRVRRHQPVQIEDVGGDRIDVFIA